MTQGNNSAFFLVLFLRWGDFCLFFGFLKSCNSSDTQSTCALDTTCLLQELRLGLILRGGWIHLGITLCWNQFSSSSFFEDFKNIGSRQRHYSCRFVYSFVSFCTMSRKPECVTLCTSSALNSRFHRNHHELSFASNIHGNLIKIHISKVLNF